MKSINEKSSSGIMEDYKDRITVAVNGYGLNNFFWEMG